MTSKVFSSVMSRREIVLETLVYSPFNHLRWPIDREGLIEVSRRESFGLHKFLSSFPHLSSNLGETQYKKSAQIVVSFVKIGAVKTVL
jgi:hypothetical protein